MTALEIFVVVAGLAGGWAIVSSLLGGGDAPGDVGDGSSCFEVLGLRQGASREEIERRYTQKRNELLQMTSGDLTLDAQRATADARQRLDDAYAKALDAHRQS